MSDAGNTAPPAVWHEGLDPETVTHITSRGWDRLDPAAAARAAASGHRAATQAIGAPPESVVRLPKDGTDPNYKAIYERVSSLGAPADAAGYTFDGVKFQDGTPLGDTFATMLREVAHAHHLPAHVAADIASRFVSFADKEAATEATRSTEMVAANKGMLAQQWGSNAEQYLFLAEKGRQVLQLPEDFLNAVARTAGYSKVMDGLRSVGARLAEPELLRGNNAPGNEAVTREQATQRLEALKQDAGWIKRWASGDTVARDELANLNRIIVGPPR
jgi:hypothetical protein